MWIWTEESELLTGSETFADVNQEQITTTLTLFPPYLFSHDVSAPQLSLLQSIYLEL